MKDDEIPTGMQESIPGVVVLHRGLNEHGQHLLNKKQLSIEFGLDRTAVAKRMDNVDPCGTDQHGNPAWTLPVAGRALMDLIARRSGARDTADFGSPHAEEKFYSAQLKKLELERQMKQVIPVVQVREKWSAVLKRLITWVGGLADELESAASLSPQQINALEKRVDDMRVELRKELVDSTREEN